MVRVVVADDDPLVRMLLRGMLEGNEIELVGEADDGAGLLAVASQARPDVVLLDLTMPDLDGLSVIRDLAAQPEPPGVVVLTNFETEAQIAAARRAGAVGEVMKAARRSELHEVIRKAAAGRPSGAE